MGSADPCAQDRSALRALETAVREAAPTQVAFAALHDALAAAIGFKVLTVQKLNLATLRSVRLYSSEPTYPIGGIKQHQRSAWSEAVLDRRAVFVAPDVATLRATFPDSAAIEATGCGSIVAAPIILGGTVLGTMNLWHREGYYDDAKGQLARPFAAVIARTVHDHSSNAD